MQTQSEIPVDQLVPLMEARTLTPRTVSRATIARWARVGIDGCRLRTVRYGATSYTSRAWLAQFAEALAGHGDGERAAIGQAQSRRASVDAAEASLRRRGLLA